MPEKFSKGRKFGQIVNSKIHLENFLMNKTLEEDFGGPWNCSLPPTAKNYGFWITSKIRWKSYKKILNMDTCSWCIGKNSSFPQLYSLAHVPWKVTLSINLSTLMGCLLSIYNPVSKTGEEKKTILIKILLMFNLSRTRLQNFGIFSSYY